MQEQFNAIQTQNKEELLRQELVAKAQSLEETVNTISQKLMLKEEALKQKEEQEKELRLENQQILKDLEVKNKEVQSLSQVWVKLEKQQIAEAIQAQETLSLINKLQ